MVTFKNLTKAQQKVFEQICCNNDKGHYSRTLDSLEHKGFIESYEQNLGGRFPVTIKRYNVPYHIHYEWCQWCSENCNEEEI